MIRTDEQRVRELYQRAADDYENNDGHSLVDTEPIEGNSVAYDLESGGIYYEILPNVVGIDDLVYVSSEAGTPSVDEDEFVERFYDVLTDALDQLE